MNLRSTPSYFSFTSPFVSHPQALGFAELYAYPDSARAKAAVRQAHDAASAQYAISEVSRWKAGNRNRLRLLENSAEDIWQGLSIARDSTRPASERFGALTKLHGIGAPIASTVLTFADELQFTIIDWRAWTALGRARRTQYSWEQYEAYLKFCQADAARLGLSLRMYDKALWVAGGKSDSDAAMLPPRIPACSLASPQ